MSKFAIFTICERKKLKSLPSGEYFAEYNKLITKREKQLSYLIKDMGLVEYEAWPVYERHLKDAVRELNTEYLHSLKFPYLAGVYDGEMGVLSCLKSIEVSRKETTTNVNFVIKPISGSYLLEMGLKNISSLRLFVNGTSLGKRAMEAIPVRNTDTYKFNWNLSFLYGFTELDGTYNIPDKCVPNSDINGKECASDRWNGMMTYDMYDELRDWIEFGLEKLEVTKVKVGGESFCQKVFPQIMATNDEKDTQVNWKGALD